MKSRKLSIKDYLTEFVVGFFFFAAVAVLIYYTMIISKDSFSKNTYRITVKFQEVANLDVGNKVLLRGMEVGAVKDLGLVDDGVMVEMAIRDGVRIFENCDVRIEASSMLGGNLVNIRQGTSDKDVVKPGQQLLGRAYSALMSEASSVLEELRGNGTFDSLSATIENFNSITDKINKGQGTLGKLINEDGFYDDAKTLIADLKKAGDSVSKAAGDISGMVGDAQKLIDDLRGDITDAVANIKKFTDKVNNDDSSIAKLFSDKGDLFNKLDKAVSELKSVSVKLNSGEGTLAKLINDPAIFEDAKATFGEIRDAFSEVKGAVQDIRESSTISTFGSFVFGAL